jgi:hypothetical protein
MNIAHVRCTRSTPYTPTKHITPAITIKMNSLFVNPHDVQRNHEVGQLLVVSTITRVPDFEALHPPRLKILKRVQAIHQIRVPSLEITIKL